MFVQESAVRQRRRQIVIVLPRLSDFRLVALAAAKFVVRVLIFILEAMLDGNRLVRHQGPGLRPLERYEFEQHYRNLPRGG